jgi:hypothetical protein
MAIAIPRRKTIKVGERRSALIELPHVQSYKIEAKDLTELSVQGMGAESDGLPMSLKGLESMSFNHFAVSYSSECIYDYEFSAYFRHCEETGDGCVFFNEDDTV